MGIYNCASRDRVAMKFVSVFTGACAAALFATSGCGVGTSKSKKTVASEDLKGTAFQKIAAKSTTASKLSLKGGKILRALSKEGEVLGVNIGILSPIEAEGIPFKTLISEPGEGYAAAANLGWFLGAKEVVHYSIEAGTPSFLRADLQASHPVVGVTQDELVTFFDGKLEIFSRSGSNIVRTVIDWPLKGEKPLSVGFDKAAKTYWLATEKNFVYIPADGSASSAPILIKLEGYKGRPQAWAFHPTASDFAQKKLPATGAVLTDEGLYVTKDLIAGAQAPKGKDDVPVADGPASPTKYDFTKDILPIAKIGCPACHDVAFANFGIVSAEASWTKAKDLLIDKLGEKPKVGNSMPLSPGVLTPANRAVLVAWLKGENRPDVAVAPTPAPPLNPGMTPVPVAFEIVPFSNTDVILVGFSRVESDGIATPPLMNLIRHVDQDPPVYGTEATMTFKFTGESGRYKVEVIAYDESDGTNLYNLYVGGTKIGADVPMNKEMDKVETFVLGASVAFTKGVDVKIGNVKQPNPDVMGSERGRTLKIVFTPVN